MNRVTDDRPILATPLDTSLTLDRDMLVRTAKA
jgi:hypothetical protein